MYKKVIYVVKTRMHYYPPCVAQIRILKSLGVNVEVWFGSSDKAILRVFDKEKIEYREIGELPEGHNGFRKVINWLSFRRNFKKYYGRLTTQDKSNTLFWFGTAETALPLVGIVPKGKYILTMLELLDDKKNYNKRKVFGLMAKKAKSVVACEETRAYLMKYWFKLNYLPYVIPNKPFKSCTNRNMNPTTNETAMAIHKIKDKKVIIYQGIFQNVEYLEAVAQALNDLNSDYYLVLMGFDLFHTNAINRLKKIYRKVIQIDSLPAPLHLEVTSYARIGLVFYKDDSLNKAFCAPNKIYEYSGFGIPAIGNNIPGLENTIGSSNAGITTKFNRENLKKAISKIDENYDVYSKNATAFFEKTDNKKTIEDLVNNLKILKEK